MSTTLQATTRLPAPESIGTTGVRRVRVALAGCGVVGGALVRLIRERGHVIEARHGIRLELVSVLVRHATRERDVPLPPGILTTDADRFLHADADVVVEAIGGLDPAERIARHALGRGRRLVTANKALLAACGAELVALADGRATLDFEAAVAGGIPAIRTIRDALADGGIRAVRGILNGTTNYILTRLAEGAAFDDALRQAQAAGFAEADPSRDLDGRDAADKIRVLAWLAFGIDPARVRVRRRGIVPEPDRLATAARAAGGVPRLLAECLPLDGGIAAVVEPVVADAASELGTVRGEENLVVVESAWNGRIRLSGPGAGGAPTAAALLSDVVRGAAVLPPASAVAATEDARQHRWVVAARSGSGEPLRRALEAAGIPAEPLEGRGDDVALTDAVAWERLAQALERVPGAVALRDAR